MRPIEMSETEYVAMLAQIIDGAGSEGIERAEIERIVAFLHQVRVDAALVEAFDRGEASIRFVGNEPTFRITDRGMAATRQEESE